MENSPHFFKVILSDTLRQGKLGIPKKLVRKYRHGLSSPVILKVPNGGTWQVELLKCGGEVWLEKGWPEFAEYHSLDRGHLLVFRYEEPRGFYVLIFDKSATEIKYPCWNSCTVVQNPDRHFQDLEIEENEDSISVEILDDPSLLRKQGEDSTHQAGRDQDFSFEEPTRADAEEDVVCVTNLDVKSSRPTTKRGKTNSPNCPPPLKKMRSETGKVMQGCDGRGRFFFRRQPWEGPANFDIARAFKSKNPYFVVTMQPSYVLGPKLSIPAWFSKLFFLQKEHGSVLLKVPGGKTWRVNVLGQSNRIRTRLTTGWSIFAQDNHLKHKDVCAFELLKFPQMTFQVSIFRASKDRCSGSSSQGQDQKLTHEQTARRKLDVQPPIVRVPLPQPASKSVSKNPFFLVQMQSAYLDTYLHIPLWFRRRYAQHWKQCVELKVGKRSWEAKFSKCGSRISIGWVLFSRENSLQVGDVCRFELIDKSKCVMKVCIRRRKL